MTDDLLAYVRRRLDDVDIDVSDLNALDMNSPAFQIAMRRGMATALHEMEHRLTDAATPLACKVRNYFRKVAPPARA
jgi:hypothetical protein